MTGVEIDFIVTDSLAALDLYERIFEVERIEVTSFPKGQNEAVFKYPQHKRNHPFYTAGILSYE